MCQIEQVAFPLHAATQYEFYQGSPYALQLGDGLHIFVDGSFEPSNGATGFGLVAFAVYEQRVAAMGVLALNMRRCPWYCDHDSNNTAELAAMAWAIEIVTHARMDVATIYYDSTYAAAAAENTQVSRQNREIAEGLAAMHWEASRRTAIVYSWTKGHSGDPYNELADVLAKQASLGFYLPPRFSMDMRRLDCALAAYRCRFDAPEHNEHWPWPDEWYFSNGKWSLPLERIFPALEQGCGDNAQQPGEGSVHIRLHPC